MKLLLLALLALAAHTADKTPAEKETRSDVQFFESANKPARTHPATKKISRLWDKGFAAMRAEKGLECMKAFAELAKLEKQEFYKASALFNQAVCLGRDRKNGDPVAAEKLMEEAWTLEPTLKEMAKEPLAQFRITSAMRKIDDGDMAGAQSLLDEAIVKDPANSSAHSELAFVHARGKRFEPCVESAGKAIELDPKFFDPLVTRGGCYLYLEQFPKALADFDKALELDPRNPVAHLNRAVLHAKMNNCDAAAKDAKVAVKGDASLKGAFQKPVNGCFFQ